MGPRISTQHESDTAHTKGCMIRMGQLNCIMRLYEGDQLYDLAKDPMELHNLWTTPLAPGSWKLCGGGLDRF